MKYIIYITTIVAILNLFLISCNSENNEPISYIQASIFIDSPTTPEWVNDISIPKGTDGFELLELSVNNEMISEWYPEYRSHFVKEIKGVAPIGNEYWSVFLWNENSLKWEPLTVGADLFSVKDGDTMAWALVEFDPDSPQLPSQKPN